MKKELLITRNPQGIAIKMCCASCRWKQPGNDTCRVCAWANIQMKVLPDHICANWEMSYPMSIAGLNADGQVKKPEYLAYYLEYYQAYIKKHPKAKLDDIVLLPFKATKEWELDNAQSRYMEI